MAKEKTDHILFVGTNCEAAPFYRNKVLITGEENPNIVHARTSRQFFEYLESNTPRRAIYTGSIRDYDERGCGWNHYVPDQIASELKRAGVGNTLKIEMDPMGSLSVNANLRDSLLV